MEKRNVILDTDISNEIDDQFALVYLLRSIENYNLEAITLAPFKGNRFSPVATLREGQELSYQTASNILDMLKMAELKEKIFKGANNFFYESKQLNLASQKIIDTARKNDKTIVLAIGAITNVAVALYNAPDITGKLEVVWLGGHSLMAENNNEYNFKQDVDGVRQVLSSGVKMTIIPCKNVASNLQTSIFEMKFMTKGMGKLGRYFCEIIKKMQKTYRENDEDFVGQNTTLWDISAVAFLNDSTAFTLKEISCPQILDDKSYQMTSGRHLVQFATDVNREKVFKDFYYKLNPKLKFVAGTKAYQNYYL